VNSQLQETKVVRDWLMEVMRRTGLKPTPLAKEAGLSPSTLLRALDDEAPSVLDRRSIKKIVDKFGVAGPALLDAPSKMATGFAEPDLVAYEMETPLFAGAALEPDQYVKKVNTRALDLDGYLPGDGVLFDMKIAPRSGDAVEAQVYTQGSAETVFRRYDAPYLVSRSSDIAGYQKPMLVDNERVKVVAVAVKMVRSRE
jgi:hypothetical protein